MKAEVSHARDPIDVATRVPKGAAQLRPELLRRDVAGNSCNRRGIQITQSLLSSSFFVFM